MSKRLRSYFELDTEYMLLILPPHSLLEDIPAKQNRFLYEAHQVQSLVLSKTCTLTIHFKLPPTLNIPLRPPVKILSIQQTQPME